MFRGEKDAAGKTTLCRVIDAQREIIDINYAAQSAIVHDL
jgi:hypothetical protein